MNLSFEALAMFIREWARLSELSAIRPDTQFERDLGITGDDGGELLEAVQEHFGIALSCSAEGYRRTFALEENEYLFHPEGLDLLSLIPFSRVPQIRSFTVGELHEAMVRAAHGDR